MTFKKENLIKKYIGKNESKDYFAFDFETYLESGRHCVYMISLCSKKEKKVWVASSMNTLEPGDEYTIIFCQNPLRDFLDYILLNYNNSYGYAHNFSNFDGYLLMEKVKHTDLKEKRPMIYADNQIFALNLRNGTILKDSLKLVGFSLKKIAESFSLKTKKMDYDIGSITAENYSSKISEVIPYCINDAVVLHEFLEVFRFRCQNISSVDPLDCLTLPQFAYRTFLADHYDPQRTALYRMTPDTYDFVRKSYYGGRVDYTVHYFKGKIHVYDVNSMYPASMCLDLPIGEGKFVPEVFFQNDPKGFLENFYGFCEAEVECPETILPFLPFRLPEGGLVFPKGRFRGFFFSEELKVAVKDCSYKLHSINRACAYKKGTEVCSSFVEKFYTIKDQASELKIKDLEMYKKWKALNSGENFFSYCIRQNPDMVLWEEKDQKPLLKKDGTAYLGRDLISVLETAGKDGEKWELCIFREKDGPMYMTAKLVNNALYGKTAQKPIENKTVLTNDIFSLVEYSEILPLDDGYRIAIVPETREKEYYPIQIAAAITAHSRILLYKAALRIGIENVLYMDTDSIITSKLFPEDLCDPKALGKWKHEGEYDELFVFGAKSYRLHGGFGTKDVGKGATKKNRKISHDYMTESYLKVLSNQDSLDCISKILPIVLEEERVFSKNKKEWKIEYQKISKTYKPLSGIKRKHIPGTFQTEPLSFPQDF